MLLWMLIWAVPMVLWVHARDPPQEVAPTLQDLDKDLDRIMDDERTFNEYYQCLLDIGPCTRDTRNFKDVIQEALERECARCSVSQRQKAITLLRLVMECRPREYAEIERQFDPSGAFKSKYMASLVARRRRLSQDPLPMGTYA